MFFHDVRVEGLHAIENIVTALQWFNAHPQDIEVLVIARGGGSLESLQPFNSLEVAKGIYSSKIPVMTAIGHELDVTIADLVADVRASVPMDAGKRLAEPWKKTEERIDTIEGTMLSCFRRTCRTLEAQLTTYRTTYLSCFTKAITQNQKLVASQQATLMRCFRDVLRGIQTIEADFSVNFERFASRLTTERRALNTQDQSLRSEAGHFFTRLATRLTSLTSQIRNSHTRYQRYLRSLQEDIAGCEGEMHQDAKRWYGAIVRKIADCEKMLLACDPKLKLRQGFSIVKDKAGKVVKSGRTVARGDIIQVELYEGVLDSQIKDIR